MLEAPYSHACIGRKHAGKGEGERGRRGGRGGPDLALWAAGARKEEEKHGGVGEKRRKKKKKEGGGGIRSTRPNQWEEKGITLNLPPPKKRKKGIFGWGYQFCWVFVGWDFSPSRRVSNGIWAFGGGWGGRGFFGPCGHVSNWVLAPPFFSLFVRE